MVRNEPIASIMREALEGYASGRFDSRPEVKSFLESSTAFPRGSDGAIHYQRVDDMLNNVIYAGYVHMPSWGVNFQPAKHEALISFETWQKIQARLNEQAKTPARNQVPVDFPLRGFVVCATCGRPLTACWSKGKYKSYPYYHCFSPSCPDYKKSIRKAVLEKEFEILLESLCPSENLFQMVVQMLRSLWADREKGLGKEAVVVKQELEAVGKKIVQLMDRIMDADSPTLVKAYEERLKNLEAEKAGLVEKARLSARPQRDFTQTFRTSLEFLKNPQKLWVSERVEDKKTVLKLVFAKPLEYAPKSGFRTPLTSCPFRLFSGFRGGEKEMVEPRGIEPLTSTMPLLRSPS